MKQKKNWKNGLFFLDHNPDNLFQNLNNIMFYCTSSAIVLLLLAKRHHMGVWKTNKGTHFNKEKKCIIEWMTFSTASQKELISVLTFELFIQFFYLFLNIVSNTLLFDPKLEACIVLLGLGKKKWDFSLKM